MATPRGARHTDLEQRLRDLEAEVRRLSFAANFQRQVVVTSGEIVVTSPGGVTVDGSAVKAIGFENTDVAAPLLVDGDDGRIELSHYPKAGSEHVRQNGLPLLTSEWSRVGNIVTIPDQGWNLRGDVFDCLYATVESDALPALLDPVPFGSLGPNLVVAEGSSTDYSAPAYDDSGWSVSAAPVGHPVGSVPGSFPATWPAAVTDTGSTNSGLWIRRTFVLPRSADVLVQGRADGQYWLYMDGVLLDSYTGTTANAWEPSIAATLAAGEHTVALHVNDDTSDPGLDYIYGDVQVVIA